VRVSPHVDTENKPTTYYRIILLYYASYTAHGRTRKVAQLQICVKSGFGKKKKKKIKTFNIDKKLNYIYILRLTQ